MNRYSKHGIAGMVAGDNDSPATMAAVDDLVPAKKRRQAVLVFANPAMIDCQRRHWPASFQQLFNTDRFVGLTSSEIDIHIFTSVESLAAKNSPYNVHLQKYVGTSFGARLEKAVESLAELGYEKIVVVGSDCPSLTADNVLRAFQLLDQNKLVLGPDHRGGCYLIGLHSEDRSQLVGVQWNRNVDFAELLQRWGATGTALLPVKLDLDALEDLRLLARSRSSWSELVAALLQTLYFPTPSYQDFLYDGTSPHQVLSWQLPPPFSPAL